VRAGYSIACSWRTLAGQPGRGAPAFLGTTGETRGRSGAKVPTGPSACPAAQLAGYSSQRKQAVDYSAGCATGPFFKENTGSRLARWRRYRSDLTQRPRAKSKIGALSWMSTAQHAIAQ
jgi:hypothetical protein